MNCKPSDAGDPRGDLRSNVFLGATLRAGSKSHPIRIRNLSVNGALIDGSELPDEGANIVLQRGSLSAQGEIAWRRDSQAGVRFNEGVAVGEWVRPTGHAGQRRVDMVVAAVRENVATATERETSGASNCPEPLEMFGNELQRICEVITELPGMTVELAEAIARIESIAHALLEFDKGQAL